jgi:hypothetical protein
VGIVEDIFYYTLSPGHKNRVQATLAKYHEASDLRYEKNFHGEDNVAVNYDEIMSYIQKLKDNYLKF